MEKFTKHKGIVAVLNRSNVDTDQIIPKQFLKRIERTGFGTHLFHDWRYLDQEESQENPNFELNATKYKGASILVTGENFGCGSSREHAPWALLNYGFRTIIAPSFADIFYNNCLKNGILLFTLEESILSSLKKNIQSDKIKELEVNLEEQKLYALEKSYDFEIDPYQKENLLEGKDEIDQSLEYIQEIESFEKEHNQNYPWYSQLKKNNI